MRPGIILFAFLMLLTGRSTAQSEQEAVKILDAFSAKASAAPSVSMKFNLVTVNQMEKTTDTLQGYLLLNKDKYRLELPDNIIFFNGENSWSYLPAEKEVTITRPDKEDDSFMSRPSNLFSMYRSGYKVRLVDEGTTAYIIDLYPEDISDEVIRIRLSIGKQLMDLRSVEYKRRDGVTATLNVLEYDLKKKPSPDDFIFRREKFGNVEIVDMR